MVYTPAAGWRRRLAGGIRHCRGTDDFECDVAARFDSDRMR
jgi:hypothetical protein